MGLRAPLVRDGLAGIEVVECSPPYDWAEQTSLISARVKVELRNREKPAYDSPLSDAVAAVEAKRGAGSNPAVAFEMVAEMLRT